MFADGRICSWRRRYDRISGNPVPLWGSSVMRALLDWWLEQLGELRPGWLRRRLSMPIDGVVVTPIEALDRKPDLVAIELRRSGKETAIGEFKVSSPQIEGLPDLRGQPAILRLSRSDVLEKTIELPLAAQKELDQVLEFEMDRQTPFNAEELYWDHRIASIDRRRGRITVRLAMVLRRNVDPLLAGLARFGIVPTRVEVLGDLSATSLIALKGARSQQPPRRLVWALAAACALLALAAAATPVLRQSLALAGLDREIVAARSAAADAEKLRQEIERLSTNAAFIAGERDKAVRPLDVLAAVTLILPDDTSLTGLELRQSKLVLTGRSAAAAPLIAALAADPLFRNPIFSAPVTRLEGAQGEVFSITVETR
jgi:general secretion pathway protein L